MEVPAPPGRLPLLVRAGAILPLLPASVDTLSRYADGSTTSLAERRRRLVLLAFPRGRSTARFYRRGRIRSAEEPAGWVLRIAGGGTRRYELQASMRTLRSPFVPCEVTVGDRRLPSAAWSFDRADGVLSATYEGRHPRLVALRRC